jgi:hypothetical protein
MSQVLGAFEMLDFTMLGPFSLGARFDTYEPFIYLIFQFFSGHGKPRILNQWTRGHDCTSKFIGRQWSCLHSTSLRAL